MPFFTFGASAAPTRLAEVRMNEADKQERDNFYKAKDSNLNSESTILSLYIIAKHKRVFYEALFKRITQLLVQIHKLQVSVRLCD